jgi:hypothetical protein
MRRSAYVCIVCVMCLCLFFFCVCMERVMILKLGATNDCLYRNKDFVEWLLYLDVDEFIYPLNEDNVTSILKKYDRNVIG